MHNAFLRYMRYLIIGLCLSTTTQNYTVLEIPLIGMVSWTAVNTLATCCLCCSQHEEKSERKNLIKDIDTIKKQELRIERDHERLYTAALNCGFAREKPFTPVSLERPSTHSDRLGSQKSTQSKAINTDLNLITPALTHGQAHHSLDKKTTPSSSECQ